ncbi:MAG: RDD family protein [Candidatus Zixiibacteriota bacterium]
MHCPSCQKSIEADSFFCQWCRRYIPNPTLGIRPNLFERWLALVIDPLLGLLLHFTFMLIVGRILPDLIYIAAIAFPIGYLIWYASLFRQGMTPGKKVMGLRVIRQETGNIPGFGLMLLREFIGRPLSGLFLGLGFLWALFDKNSQGWHDKLAGTVVIKTRLGSAVIPKHTSTRSETVVDKVDVFVEDPRLKAKEELLRQQLQLEPLNVDLLLKHGNVLDQCGMLQEATQELEKVLAIDSSHQIALCQIARTYYELDQFENAKKSLKQLSALTITNSKEILELANLLILINNDADTATYILSEKLKDDPENLELLSGLLEIYNSMGNLEAADEIAQKIMKSGSDDFNILYILAQAKLVKGQFKEASEYTNRARILKPDSQSVILLDSLSRLFLSEPTDSQIHESILRELEEIDISDLDHDERLKLEFVLSAAKIALKKADKLDNNTIITYMKSSPQKSNYYSAFIFTCYEKWIEGATGQEAIELLPHLEHLRQIEDWKDDTNLSIHIHSEAGKFYLKESARKKALYHYKEATKLAPSNEEYNINLSKALKGVKRRNRRLIIAACTILLLIVSGVVLTQWLKLRTEKAYFDSVASGIYPEMYIWKYPEGKYLERARELIDSLDAQLISVRMSKVKEQVSKWGDWQRMYHINGGRQKITPTYNGGYIIAYSDYLSGGDFKGKDGIEVINVGPDGGERWRENYSGTETENEIAPCPSGGFMMAVGKSLYRISDLGHVIWTRDLIEDKSHIYELLVNESGNYLIAFTITEEGSFENKDRKSISEKIHLKMYDSLDQQLWDAVIGDEEEFHIPFSLKADNRGGYVLLGFFRQLHPKTKRGYYLVRIDSTGSKSWEIECTDFSLHAINTLPGKPDIINTRDGGYLLAQQTGLTKYSLDGQKEWLKPWDWDAKYYSFSIASASGDIYNLLAMHEGVTNPGRDRLVSFNARGHIRRNTSLDIYSSWETITLTADGGLLLSGDLHGHPNPGITNKSDQYNELVITKFNPKKGLPIELTQGLLQDYTHWKGSWKVHGGKSSTRIRIKIMDIFGDRFDGYFYETIQGSEYEVGPLSGTINKKDINFEIWTKENMNGAIYRFNLKFDGRLYGNEIGGSWRRIRKATGRDWTTGTFSVSRIMLNTIK